MTESVAKLVQQIRDLEEELEREVDKRRAEFRYRIERGRIIFEREIKREHQAIRKRLLPYIAGARPMVLLTAPVIYSVLLPLVVLDIFVTLYQAICFPVYGIEKVQRRDHVTFDRQHLAYLNGLEKLNCVYCSYANGLLSYAREIAGRTEKHWCPIKHARRLSGTHQYYPDFLEYGDAHGYRHRSSAGDSD